jgi:anti-sigma regulatory factor (Ser/Thr protein kinase)
MPAHRFAMNPSDQRDFPARMAMLAETAAFVEGFCVRHGVGRDDALRLTLIVEELFTNTVTHGFGGDSDALIGVHLTRAPDHVEVRYEDRAAPHDPVGRMRSSPASLDAPLEMRPVGGLGIHLVGQLSASVRYAYEHGMNRLWLVVACRS